MKNTTSRLRRVVPASLLGIGLVATGMVAGPAVAGAQDEGSTGSTIIEEQSALRGDPLAPLVEDGTITQAQADAIQANLGERGPGRRGPSLGMRGAPDSTVVAEMLGLSEEDLRIELEAGATLADVAEANGVDTQTLIDTLAAEQETRLEEAVADGHLTEEQAADRAESIVERVTARVNGDDPGHRGPPHPGEDTNVEDADEYEDDDYEVDEEEVDEDDD